MNSDAMKSFLDEHAEYQTYLYTRGFCISTNHLNLDQYPFYGNWNSYEITDSIVIYSDKRKKVHLFHKNGRYYFLIGHAYDPFSGCTDETLILKNAAESDDFWTLIGQITGIFCIGYIEGNQISFTTDAAGQQMVYYGNIDGYTYITSHAKLVGDICGLKQDPYVTELVNYKFYHFFGTVLPGDLSPYKELKRCQCNFSTTITTNHVSVSRFWPKNPIRVCATEAEYKQTIYQIADILTNTMKAIGKKWDNPKPAISVTGGMDSKTTMACASPVYGKFSYFSYDSLPDEKVDADAAHELCETLGLEHKVYTIPVNDGEYADFEMMREIFAFNSGCIGYNNRNDVRKRLYFINQNDFELEIKSWVDEIGRARYHKRFSKKSFPQNPTARYLTSFYKAFLHNRKLVQNTDKIFAEYMQKYWGDDVLSMVDWWDLFYWEFEWGAAEGLFLTSELNFAYDTTIPFNNRRLLELMLSVPLQKRIEDRIQHDVIVMMNSQIAESGIHVNDVSHTKLRSYIERLYLEINTRLPF